MFTGIVVDQGKVTSIAEGAGSRRIWIATALDTDSMAIGASVACDGCCLTVVAKEPGRFAVDVAAETMAVTNAGKWLEGTVINLEPSLRLGDELGGHMVSGHVDGLAVVESVTADGDSWRLKIRVPDQLAAFIAPKGSVALNGISLTVNEVEGSVFGVCIIPHTWMVTNIAALKPGDSLHLEVDMLARYVARILGKAA